MFQFERWRWMSGGLAIVTALVLAFTWSGPPATPVSASGPANLNFTVQDMNGQTVRLADFRGRPVILNFWATWCGPCRAEIPEFNTLAEQYKAQGLVVLGVSVDDKPEALRKFTQEFPMKYPVLVGLGHDELQEAYDAVLAVPVTWFIRADGSVQHAQKGPATREFFEAQTKALVQSSTGGRP